MAKKNQTLTWDKAVPAPVVLISGPENFLADMAFNAIRDALKKADPELAVHEINAESYDAGQLLTYASPSLFGESRLIRVSHVEKANDHFLSEALGYIKYPDSGAYLILRHEKGVRGKALLEAVRQMSGSAEDQAVEISCPALSPRDKPALVRQYVGKLGSKIDNFALNQLTEAYQGSLEELMNAVRQLAQNAGSGAINTQDVEVLTGGRVETTAFRVADVAISGNAREALVLLRQALATGTAAIPLLGAINQKIRTMAKVHGARKSSAQLAEEFGLRGWMAEKAMRDVAGWKEKNLARVLDLGAATEEKLKGGSRDPVYALEKYVLAIALRGAD